MTFWHHFLAWLRGDLNKITSEFDAIYDKLSKHAGYKAGLASQQHEHSVALLSAANKNAEEADKALTIRANIGKLLGK